MHNYLVCVILCLTFITKNLVRTPLVPQKVPSPLPHWYYKHSTVFKISDIYVRKQAIILKKAMFGYTRGCVNPSLILTMLFPTCFGLYSVILTQIIKKQLWEFRLAWHLDRTWVTNMVVGKFLLLTVNSWFNPLNAELNPICYLLALLWAHHFLHVSRIRVKSVQLWSYVSVALIQVMLTVC